MAQKFVEVQITKDEAQALDLKEIALCGDLAGCEYPNCDCTRTWVTAERFKWLYSL